MSAESVKEKVVALFRRLVGEKAAILRATHYPAGINSLITQALAEDCQSQDEDTVIDSVGFHLVDWQTDAAFLVALHLFPDEFTPDEIREGVRDFFAHVPAHVITAAKAYQKATGFCVDLEPFDEPDETQTPN